MTDNSNPAPRADSQPRTLHAGDARAVLFGEVTTRNDIARDIIAGFAAVTPALTGIWRYLDKALADVPAALAELGRTRADLEAVRLDRANLLAAMRATLGAHADGEPDPLYYLRDELDARQVPAQRHGRAS
jgi:hypothetical protein